MMEKIQSFETQSGFRELSDKEYEDLAETVIYLFENQTSGHDNWFAVDTNEFSEKNIEGVLISISSGQDNISDESVAYTKAPDNQIDRESLCGEITEILKKNKVNKISWFEKGSMCLLKENKNIEYGNLEEVGSIGFLYELKTGDEYYWRVVADKYSVEQGRRQGIQIKKRLEESDDKTVWNSDMVKFNKNNDKKSWSYNTIKSSVNLDNYPGNYHPYIDNFDGETCFIEVGMTNDQRFSFGDKNIDTSHWGEPNDYVKFTELEEKN